MDGNWQTDFCNNLYSLFCRFFVLYVEKWKWIKSRHQSVIFTHWTEIILLKDCDGENVQCGVCDWVIVCGNAQRKLKGSAIVVDWGVKELFYGVILYTFYDIL